MSQRAVLAAALTLAVSVFAGCRLERSDSTPRWSKTRTERLALFAGIEKLAIAPFRDPRENPGMDADMFARLVANELLPYKRFKIIYPSQIEAAVRKAKLHPRKKEDVIDLEGSEEDAVQAAKLVKADAVLVARIHDFGVYPPKRLAVTFRVYVAGTPHRSFIDMVNMTSAGVPAEVPGPLRDRFIWERQWSYDAGRKRTRTGMSFYARKHETDRGFGEEIAYYSTKKFLGFVAADITGKLYSDAQWYRSGAGAALGRKHGIDYAALERARGGSGYSFGAGDSGVEPGRGSRPGRSSLRPGSSRGMPR